jgi:hypothetical protein
MMALSEIQVEKQQRRLTGIYTNKIKIGFDGEILEVAWSLMGLNGAENWI